MIRFLLSRLWSGLLVIVGVVLVVFVLFIVLPGDPARLTLGQRADVSTLEAINKEFGLDKPKGTQLLLYLADLSPIATHGTDSANRAKYNYVKLFNTGADRALVLKKPYLRRSYQSQQAVSQILSEALPNTVILALAAFIFAAVLGIILGVIGAVKHHTWVDNLAMLIANLGISVPSFFAAILIAWLFGFVWSRYTGLSMSGSLYDIDFYKGRIMAWQNLILPAIALGIRPLSIITQLTRSSMLDVMTQDYVRTATAKGLSTRAVVVKHTLRNALNPVLTAVSGWLASLMAGAFFIEYIFGWRGLGKVTVDALLASDFPVVMGSVLYIAVIFVVINVLVDILYGVLDPRVRI
jgi:peptide/nickel transport system permease protein